METKHYTQLGQEERDRIFQLKQDGLSNSDIAKELGRDKSTIGRELKRNSHQKLGQYLPDTAQRKAEKRKASRRKKRYVDKDPRLKATIIKLLKKGWSPDLISGRLERLNKSYLNQESIYQFIYSLEGRKGNLRQFLRRAHRIRHPKGGRKPRKTKIPNRVDIAKRPKIVEKRTQFGHWEGDNVVYNRHRESLSTSVERKTRKIIISKPRDLTAKAKSKVLISRFRRLPEKARRSMTYDNGKEATDHQAVTAAVGMPFYFAKTYASWQRGTNENKNGLVRFYLPKGTDLSKLSWQDIRKVENKINNRPVKLLGYMTPNEAFAMETSKVKSKSLHKKLFI